MKKLLLLLCICLLAVPMLSTAEEKIYVALGDSITTGYGLAKDEKGFAQLLAEEKGYALTNLAVNGATAKDVSRLLSRKSVQYTVAKADFITLTCGGNDLMGLIFTQAAEAFNALSPAKINAGQVSQILADPNDGRQTALLGVLQQLLLGSENIPAFADSPVMDAALDAFVTNLTDIIAKIRAVNPDAVIIVSTQYNPFAFFSDAYEPLAASLDKGVKKLSDAIEENAQTAGYKVADAYGAFAASPDNLCCAHMHPFNPDPHPNVRGHAVLAECFSGVIDSLP
ncbi:MAG: hypothetical protein IKW00_03680 [Clostridia bacterium]|nr:hypothetical protein [Clostridia bacterium]